MTNYLTYFTFYFGKKSNYIGIFSKENCFEISGVNKSNLNSGIALLSN